MSSNSLIYARDETGKNRVLQCSNEGYLTVGVTANAGSTISIADFDNNENTLKINPNGSIDTNIVLTNYATETTLQDINIYSGLMSENITQMNFIVEDGISKLETRDASVYNTLIDTNSKIDDTNTKLDAQILLLENIDTHNETIISELELINTNIINKHLDSLTDSVSSILVDPTNNNKARIEPLSNANIYPTDNGLICSSIMYGFNSSLNVFEKIGVDDEKIKVIIPDGVNITTMPALQAGTDGISIYGSDGVNDIIIKTDSTGKLEVDATVNVISGFNLETTQQLIKTDLDNIDTQLNNLQFTTPDKNLKVDIAQAETPLDVHLYGWTGSGSSQEKIRTDTHNNLCTRLSNDNQTVFNTFDIDGGVNCHITNTSLPITFTGGDVNIKDSTGNDITSISTAGAVNGALKTVLVGQTTNANIGDTSANPHGITKTGLNNFIINSYSTPVVMGGYTGSDVVGIKTTSGGNIITALDSSNNTIKIDSSNNTIKIDSSNNIVGLSTSNNTIKIDTSNNGIKIPLNSSASSAIVGSLSVSLPNSQTGLIVGSNNYGRNNIANSQDLITCYNNGGVISPNYVAQDVYIRNNTTTNEYNKTGLNIYQIYPKKIHYTLAGRTESGLANVLMGGAGSSVTITASVLFGKANPQTFSAVLATGSTVPRTLKYHYVDVNGDLQTNGSTVISATNTPVVLGTNYISINKFWIDAFNFGSVALDEVFIRYGASNTPANTVCSSNINTYFNGIITVPNGYIGYLTRIDCYYPANGYLNVIKWDENSVRTNTYSIFNPGNTATTNILGGDNGSIGTIYTAGESIAFMRPTAMGASIAGGTFVLEPI